MRTRVFATVSSYSASARESHVMPPPTPYAARPVRASCSTVRIATLKRALGPTAPAGAMNPTVPQYTPRAATSRPAMIRIVDTLGAPVTDPLGNSAAKMSPSPISGRRSALTVDVSCQTVSYRSAANTSLHVTEPLRATRPMSLRSRSTIIAFSARSFTDPSSPERIDSSSASHRPRGAVPFIGLVTIRSPSIRKKSSGEADSDRDASRCRRRPPYAPRCA